MQPYIFYPCLAAAILIAMRLLSLPIKWIAKLMINAVVGVVLILILSSLEAYIGMTIGINALTLTASAVLGVPGIILLLMLRWLFMM